MITQREKEIAMASVFDPQLFDDFTEWIKNNCAPEEISEEQQLDAWASRNGYTR